MKTISFLIILSLLLGIPCYAEQEQAIAENGRSINYQAHSAKAEISKENQLVDFYQATAKKSLFQRDKWIIEVNDQSTTMKGDIPKIVTGKYTQKYTVYRDGDRIDSRSERSGSLGENSERKYAKRNYQSLLLDGRVYDYQRREGLEDQPKMVVTHKDLTRRVINSAGSRALALAGYMQGDLKPLSEILSEESSVLHTLPSMQMINGFPTYLLKANTPYGKYTVWMDPNCGYSPRRVIVERGPKDLYNGKPVSTLPPPPPPGFTRKPLPTREHVRFVLEISKIKEIDGGFMATEGSTTLSTDFSDGSKEEIQGVCEFILIDLDPDFNEIPDAFVLGVPEGIQVLNMDFPGGKFKWQNGKMEPLIAQNIPLLNKPLPELIDFKITISPADAKDKLFLVCFFDMNQRPSRNCLLQLSKKAKELTAKDVVFIAVQASKVDEDKLNDWVKKNNIPFPAGMVQGDEEEIRFSWGVRSLPWLILTNKKHIIRAEGFGIEELDEELKKIEVTPAKQINPTNNPKPSKSFLNAEEILTAWESTYRSIRTMRFSYVYRLVDFQPSQMTEDNPDEPTPNPVKDKHVERIEEGKRYHLRYSLAEDGFNNPEWLVEFAFDGKITQSYMGSTKSGVISLNQRSGSEETDGGLKRFMFLTNHKTPDILKDEYPNGIPELALWFKLGKLRGKVIIRPNLEYVAGQPCHVVEVIDDSNVRGESRELKQVFWMAHDRGMCPMKFQRLENGKLEKEIAIEKIAVMERDNNNVWYPQKAYSTVYFDEMVIRNELTVTDFVPNIKVDESTFRLEFIEGTQVTDMNSMKSYKWRKGMKFIFDEWNNSIRYVTKDWSIIVDVGKPLPTFECIKLNLPTERTNGRPILLCFFDMNQRPSRNCLLQLSKKAKELTAKDIIVVAIQASKVDEDKLNDWVKENNISFLVRMIKSDEEKTRFTWGVRSLPWLILTNKEHIVTAEGFSMSELDKLNNNSD